MNKKNTLILGIGVVMAIVFSVVALAKHTNVVTPPLGGTSPDFSSQYFDVNGVYMYFAHRTFNPASTTVCSLPAPLATSTLDYAYVTIATATTTSTAWDIAKASNPTSTTTVFEDVVVPANKNGTMTFSTSSPSNSASLTGQLDPNVVFAAAISTSTDANGNNISGYTNQQYLNVAYGGYPIGTGTTNPTGSCEAEWNINQ